MWKLQLIIPFFIALGSTNDCVPKSFGADSIVCVCNGTYCDSTPDNNPPIPEKGTYYWYMSSKAGHRMNMKKGQFNSCKGSAASVTITVDTTKKYQTIFGFGGAFTDSTGINIKKLSPAAQDQIIRTYYDPILGSRYLLGRIPIAGSDFSTKFYTYDNVTDDVSLKHFSLATEDYQYKIPFLQKAVELNPAVKFFAATWSPPLWMKTNERINGFGFLKPQYYQTYADYILKFLDEYKKNDLDIWAVSTGNEPINAFIPFDKLSTMGWTPNTMATWIANNLGPTLAASPHNTTILVLDDQRIELPWFVKQVFRNEKAKTYSIGTAVHWYADAFISSKVLDETHNYFPNKLILLTEACTGVGMSDAKSVILGSWERGQKYILSIIDYMNHWSVGWVDWNMVLDKQGGPNWIQNYVDSPIIVNPETDEFYKQPMYYAIKHFSRFVDRGSVRIHTTNQKAIYSTGFVTPSNGVVVVLYNRNDAPKNVILNDLEKGSLCIEVPPYSMNTIIYGQ